MESTIAIIGIFVNASTGGISFSNIPKTGDITIPTGTKFTIFYTKTTDTPWSGKFVPQGYGYVSSGDIYSFEERQVGVFADGKPLYQKTVSCGTLPNNTTKEIEHGISNIDDVANIFVIAKNPTSGVWQNVPTVNTTNLNQQIQAWISGTKVHIRSAIDYSAYTSCYVTIQYTKTTDVAGSGEYVPSGDKAVHYSTEEEVIGTFMGDTLYRRVFDLGSDLAILQNTFTTTSIDASSMETLVTAKAIHSTGVTVYNVMANINNGVIRLQADRNDNSIGARYIVLEYTKTS